MASILIGTFFVALAIGVPVAFVMGVAGLAAIVFGGTLPGIVIPQQMFKGINSFPLMAVPFFILTSELMTEGGLTTPLLRFAQALVGHIRGGLGYVNVLVSMLFAGISGSALADAAGPGAVIMRMMRRAGYDGNYAGALSAATATIGPIIPPSILMVVYAISDNNVTVAGLFLAGVAPGLMLAIALAGANGVIAHKRGYLFHDRRQTLGERAHAFRDAIPALLMPAIIIGGILLGIFTPTEAAAVAVAYALVIGLFVTRELTLAKLPRIFLHAGVITSGVLLIVAMASIFAWLLTILQIPQGLAGLLAGLTDDPLVILLLLAVFALASGLVIDTLPALIILVPILAPVAAQFGIDPLHFAMMLVLNLTIGMVTPPVGPVLFVIGTVGRLRIEELARAVLPLVLAELVVLVIVILVPQLSTFIPEILGFTR